MISLQVYDATRKLPVKFVVTHTYSGATPRRISRFKPRDWIIAMSHRSFTCEQLAYSYGVYPIMVSNPCNDLEKKTLGVLSSKGIGEKGDMIVLTQGHSGGTNILKIMELGDMSEDLDNTTA